MHPAWLGVGEHAGSQSSCVLRITGKWDLQAITCNVTSVGLRVRPDHDSLLYGRGSSSMNAVLMYIALRNNSVIRHMYIHIRVNL